LSSTTIQFQRRGLLMVISAPSGCGKSVVLKRLLAGQPSLRYSVSVTSRPPRETEVEGRDYHFVTRRQFETMVGKGAFYEWAEVHGNLYGTRVDAVEAALGKGQDMVMDLDVQGGVAVKRRMPDAVLVFLMPPSLVVLEKRLRGRATEPEEQINRRLINARNEMEYWIDYDYVLVNEKLEQTVEAVRKILEAERYRAGRLKLVATMSS
jgi:guanylate kinase